MKLPTSYIVLLLTVFLFSCNREDKNTYPVKPEEARKMLILTETKGFRQESIEAGWAMFNNQADQWNIEVSHAEESAVMAEQDIKS